MRAAGWDTKTANISAKFWLGDDRILKDTSFDVVVANSDVAKLLMSVLGGLLCAAYQIVRARRMKHALLFSAF